MFRPLKELGNGYPKGRKETEARRQAMAGKFMVGASVFLGACLAICGCQNSPPRYASTQPTSGFSQGQGSMNPPVVGQNSGLPQNGSSTFSPSPNGTTVTYPGTQPGGIGAAPSTTPSMLGSQSRTTQNFAPSSGGLSGGPGFGPPNTALGSGPQGFTPPPPPPPPGGPAIP
jgi:hypothetical protein